MSSLLLASRLHHLSTKTSPGQQLYIVLVERHILINPPLNLSLRFGLWDRLREVLKIDVVVEVVLHAIVHNEMTHAICRCCRCFGFSGSEVFDVFTVFEVVVVSSVSVVFEVFEVFEVLEVFGVLYVSLSFSGLGGLGRFEGLSS